MEDLVYAGSHGFDIHGPDGLEMQHQDARRPLPELDAAEEHLACKAGFRGAMYPWQSGSSGREESQVLHLNPKSGEWQPDDTHRQRHVNAAIAYNICRYFPATGDIEFLSFYGAELLLEIARFWASIATYNAQRDRYEIHHVVGPDEFHTHYPDSDGPGLNNNAYTNVMAVWVLCFARRALELLSEERKRELTTQLGIDDEELERWDTYRPGNARFDPVVQSVPARTTGRDPHAHPLSRPLAVGAGDWHKAGCPTRAQPRGFRPNRIPGPDRNAGSRRKLRMETWREVT